VSRAVGRGVFLTCTWPSSRGAPATTQASSTPEYPAPTTSTLMGRRLPPANCVRSRAVSLLSTA